MYVEIVDPPAATASIRNVPVVLGLNVEEVVPFTLNVVNFPASVPLSFNATAAEPFAYSPNRPSKMGKGPV